MDILKTIIEKCNALQIYEKRDINDGYCELVFDNKEIDKLEKILIEILGTATKPPGTKPTKEDIKLTKDYGGIHDNQTLFKKTFDETTVIAMLWPWQDNAHTTLKIALLGK